MKARNKMLAKKLQVSTVSNTILHVRNKSFVNWYDLIDDLCQFYAVH